MIVGHTGCCNGSHSGDGSRMDFPPARPQRGRGRTPENPSENRAEKDLEKSLLVHTSKSIHTLGVVSDHKTVEIQWFRRNEKSCEYEQIPAPDTARFERYYLQCAAREILLSAPHPRGDGKPWQTVFCLRHLADFASGVSVLLGKEFKNAHFGGLKTCGSVWTCPLCASKISQRREQEVQIAGDKHITDGGFLYMVTFTCRHSRQDSLELLLGSQKGRNGLASALQRLRNSRTYKSVSKKIDLVGLIRNLEVTQSEANGWHPHVHELWFVLQELSAADIALVKQMIFEAWHEACRKAGLPLPNHKHGVDIVRAYSPAEYLQKWGREQKWGAGAELTKSHIKNSKDRKGRTPFDLLRLYREGGPKAGYYGKLFLEYSVAFFGKRQCYWSPGLKKRFGIGELSDEEIAAREEEQSEVIVCIDRETWKRVLKRKWDARPTILRLAETGGKEAVELYLSDFEDSS